MVLQQKTTNRGFLSPRQLADIENLANIARATGATLTMHGVTVGGKAECSPPPPVKSTMPDGRQAKTPSETPSKEKQKHMQRLADYNEAKRAAACGARWLPLAQMLLRRSRAKLRSDVWTARRRALGALRTKACDLLRRAWQHAEQRLAPADSGCMAPWPNAATPSGMCWPAAYLTAEPYDSPVSSPLPGQVCYSDVIPTCDDGANRTGHGKKRRGKKSRGGAT